MRVRVGRWLMITGCAAVLGAGCSSNNNSSTSGSTITESFSGVVTAGNSWIQTVNVVSSGEFDVQVVSISPQSTITLGVGIGQVVSGQCILLNYVDNSRVGSIVSALVAPGSYCVDVADIGNVQGSDTVTVSVTHP